MLAQVVPRGQPAGEGDVGRVAVAGGAVDVRPAGEGQAEHACHLVEGLARRVVDRGTQRANVRRHVRDQQQRGVATGDEQREAGFRQRTVLELVYRDMCREVVDAVERRPEGQREGLGGRDPHEQRAGQPRPAGDRDRVQVLEVHPGLGAGPLDCGHHRLQVRPARDLGHHAAEACMLLDAARDRIGQQGVAAHDANARLVAGRLDAQHQRPVGRRRGGRRPAGRHLAHGRTDSQPRLRSTSASTPPGW